MMLFFVLVIVFEVRTSRYVRYRMTKQGSLTTDATRVDPPRCLGRAGSLRIRLDRSADVDAMGLGGQLALPDSDLASL
jgi:hypothetical protein